MSKKVIVVGGGFAGVAAVNKLAKVKDLEIQLVDRRNHHLFQPLLYQVAMAGLNPSDIATPLRKLFGRKNNVKVTLAEVTDVNLQENKINFDNQWHSYDYLILACGSKHFYFGNDQWEEFAPGLKTIEQATEIRRRILLALELADKEPDPDKRKQLLTFAIVGGGPTGVELAGSIAEMTKRTLDGDYSELDLTQTRVVLVEAGDRVLGAFPEKLSARAKKDLEELGVEVLLNCRASDLGFIGLTVGDSFLATKTIIWAAGIKPSQLSEMVKSEKIKDGRIRVGSDLSLANYPNAFVLGDQAACKDAKTGEDLPTLAPVAMQQGKFVGALIASELKGKPRGPFEYFDKGIMATIGRSRAVVSTGPFQFSGLFAWLTWVFVHIAYLSQTRNRFFVLLQWSWSYFRFGSGARLIVHKTWKFYGKEKIPITRPDA